MSSAAEESKLAPVTASAPVSLPANPSTLLAYGLAVLTSHDNAEKVRLTLEAYQKWKKDELPLGDMKECPLPPDHPARPLHLTTIAPHLMPKPVKGDHEGNRLRLIHSQAHIESYAIDLSWDILVRFVGPDRTLKGEALPRDFFSDWLQVAEDEARHFNIWNSRLKELKSSYGALPVHDGLWQSASDTKDSLLSRLAVVHMVHEARGLDQAPRIKAQFASGGDKKSAVLLTAIEKDEVTHVGAGITWFKYLCQRSQPPLDPIPTFQSIIAEKFRGSLRPPFAVDVRASIGFTPEWYLPMVHENFRAQVRDEAEKRGIRFRSEQAPSNSSASESASESSESAAASAPSS